MLSNQAINESWCFIRGRTIVVSEIVTLIYIVWIQQSLAIHYCNQPVLAITLDLNVTYSVLQLLFSFMEASWYGLDYYMQAITTTGRC